MREDPREHLEFVVNQYDLNPQPKAALLVEGEIEVVFTDTIFRKMFGVHHGVSGIEFLNLGGVGRATGNRRHDRFHAFFQLIDYLLDHQTLVFLLLDNENQANKLKAAADSKRSTFGVRQRVTSPDRIRLWNQSFQLDNFTDDEIAWAMAVAAERRVEFDAADIGTARSARPTRILVHVYRTRTGADL